MIDPITASTHELEFVYWLLVAVRLAFPFSKTNDCLNFLAPAAALHSLLPARRPPYKTGPRYAC
jgi:hypothetical protein